MALIDNNFCCFCKTNRETVMHLFCDCNKLFGFQNFEPPSKALLLDCFIECKIFKHKYIHTKPTITSFLITMNIAKSTEYFIAKRKGPSIKDVRSPGERGVCPVRTFCRQREVLEMRTSAPFGAKTPDFSKFIVRPHGQGGRGSSTDNFRIRREGTFFRDFVRTSFMDGPFIFSFYRNPFYLPILSNCYRNII